MARTTHRRLTDDDLLALPDDGHRHELIDGERWLAGPARVRNVAGKQVRVGATMGTFYTRCRFENPVDRKRSIVVARLLVDVGSGFTWAPKWALERLGIQREKKHVAFVLANGQQVTRSVGFAIIRLDKAFTIDEVVFAEPGDLLLLGARTLEGLNLAVEPGRKKLVAAGPLPAAAERAV